MVQKSNYVIKRGARDCNLILAFRVCYRCIRFDSTQTMPARTLRPRESALEQSIPRIFNQVQDSAVNHNKNHVALHKIQAELAEHTEDLQKGKLVKLIGERIFQDKFIHMFCRALPLKKGIDS